jgi:UDP-galactopyranose mutase
MLDHPNIDVSVRTDYREVAGEVDYDHLVYTGTIDGFFDHRFGALPYRSLEFELRNEPTSDGRPLQPVAQVNEPSEATPYTRITEFRHITGQQHPTSTVAIEYSRSEGDPYYPIPRDDTRALYHQYEALAAELPDVTFVGRLARYQYLNMDQVVAQALSTAEKLLARLQSTSVRYRTLPQTSVASSPTSTATRPGSSNAAAAPRAPSADRT